MAIDLKLLDSKLSQLITNSTSTTLSRVTKQVSQGETFKLNGKTVKALTSVTNGEEVLVFKNSSDGAYYCIAGRKEDSRVINQRINLSRHTMPVKKPSAPLACKILKLAYIYKIKREDFTQDLYLVDFSGRHHLIQTIPACTRHFWDAEWTYEITIPGYTRKTYEFYQWYTLSVASEVFEIERGSFRDPQRVDEILGNPPDPDIIQVFGPANLQGTKPFGPNETAPGLEIGTTTFSLSEVFDFGILSWVSSQCAARLEPPFRLPPGHPDNPLTDGVSYFNTSPDYSVFIYSGYQNITEEDEGDDDEILRYSEIINTPSYTVEFVRYTSTGDPLDEDPRKMGYYWGQPWGELNPAYEGGGQNNPEGSYDLNLDDAKWYGRSAYARYFYVFDSGGLSVNVPPNQERPAPEDEYSEVEVYMSYANGSIDILIRDSGRPEGQAPDHPSRPTEGPDVDPPEYFPPGSIYRKRFNGSTFDDILTEDLPNWVQAFDSPDTINDIYTDLEAELQSLYLVDEEWFIDGNQTDFLILDILNRQRNLIPGEDYLIEDTPQIVDSGWVDPDTGLPTVWGWLFQFVSTDELKIQLFMEEDGPFIFPYYIYPYQVEPTGLVGPGGGDTELNNDYLPPSSSTSTNQLEIKVSRLNSSDFPDVDIGENFSIEAMTASWDKNNTIYICHSTKYVGPINPGGS